MSAARHPDGSERRAATELRAAATGRRLEGYAAVFDSAAPIGSFTEVVRRGAFARSLASGRDVVVLVDHDPSRFLGRTSSRTLRLAEDARGLHFEVDVPDTTLGRDVLALAERGDLGGASFTFRPVEERWSPSRSRRELLSVDLLEVSVVQSFPAYRATTVSARARAGAASLLRTRRLIARTL